MPKVPFGEYLPDQPDFENKGSVIIKNVLPSAASYKPFPSQVRFSSNRLLERVKGAFAAIDRNQVVHLYAGTNKFLYKLSGTSWTTASFSLSGTTSFGVATNDSWEFAQYGQNVIAVNINDPVQSVSAGASQFDSLITSSTKPQARHVAVVRDFLVLGNVIENAVRHPTRVRWSAFDNAADFDQSQTTLSDFQDLFGNGGPIQRIIGGEEGIIIQERSIWKMTFIGTPLVFQFDELQPNRGTIAPYSVTRYGDRIFYLDEDGFYMMDARGGGIKPIGFSRVDRSFFNDLASGQISNVRVAVDPNEGIVVWAYPGPGNNDGVPNRLIIYNWKLDRWSTAETEVQDIVRLLSPGYTLEQLDQFNTSLDNLQFSLDSNAYAGGQAEFSGFDSMGYLTFFQGSPLPATLDTKELQFREGYRQAVMAVRPYVETSGNSSLSLSVAVAVRNRLDESVSYGPNISLNQIGEAPTRSNGRFMRFRVRIDGNFRDAVGVNALQATKTGRR